MKELYELKGQGRSIAEYTNQGNEAAVVPPTDPANSVQFGAQLSQ